MMSDDLKAFINDLSSYCTGEQLKAEKAADINKKGAMRTRQMDSALGEVVAFKKIKEFAYQYYVNNK